MPRPAYLVPSRDGRLSPASPLTRVDFIGGKNIFHRFPRQPSRSIVFMRLHPEISFSTLNMRADKSFDPRFGAERNFDVGITHRNWFPCKWTCLPVFARPGHRPGHRRGEGETPRELRRTLMGVTTHSQRETAAVVVGASLDRLLRQTYITASVRPVLRSPPPSFLLPFPPSPSLLFSQQCSQWTASFLLRSTAREGLSSASVG